MRGQHDAAQYLAQQKGGTHMAYRILKSLISNSAKSGTELTEMADVYYGAGRLTTEEYCDILERINTMAD